MTSKDSLCNPPSKKHKNKKHEEQRRRGQKQISRRNGTEPRKRKSGGKNLNVTGLREI